MQKAVQCLIDHDVIPESELRKAKWLKGDRVILNAEFTNWYTTHDNVNYKGRTLPDWTDQAEKAGETWQCPL